MVPKYFLNYSKTIFTFAVGFKWIILVLLICYILEKKMLIVTLTLAILLCLLGLIEDSNGFQARTELMGIIFFVQFLAYSKYFNPKNLPKNRVQFSVQVIAASYVISALSKMQDSRLMWVSDAQYLPVQILRSIHINEVTYPEYSEWYRLVVDWMLLHPNVVTFLISTALLLELFAFIAIFSKRNAFVWGILLICMHIGINYSMSIVLKFIAYPMAIFFSNIYYFFGLIIFSILVLLKNALLLLFLQTKTLITKN